MAAAAIMEAFINETTQGKQKENMEKNKSNLKKHLQYTDPPTRDLPAPRDNGPNTPTFGGANKTGFELVCKFIKEYHEYTITKVNQKNEDHKTEVLRDVALMVTGNSSLAVSNLDTNREIKTNFVSSIETASENRVAQEGDIKKVMEILRQQGSTNEEGFKKLVPGSETPGAVNHAEIIKAVEKVHQINESKVQSFIREQTSTLNKTIKDAQMKQTGSGNTVGTRPPFGPPRTTPATTAWGTPSNPRPPPAAPTQTPTPTPTPSSSGSGNTQETNQVQEFITVSRPVAAKDPLTGKETTEWIDVHNVKKRNKDFRFTKDAEDAFKQEENKQAAITRARKQIMIYGLPDPPVGDKKTEIGNIRLVADEFGKKWLKEKGFIIQKSDLKNCITQRLWNYGGKTHKGPKPLKITFDSPEIANKFMTAAKAAGCDSSRTKIKLGKFQNISVEDPDWPTYYLRPGTTWEERQRFKAKQDERAAHRASIEYERYKGAQERTKNNTHRVADGDLDELTFLDPDDTGKDNTANQEQTDVGANSEPGLGSGNDKEKEAKDLAEKQLQGNVETEIINKDGDTGTDAGIQVPTETTGDSEAMDMDTTDSENDRKRKSNEMSPQNSLVHEKQSKKTSSGASSQDF